MSPFCSVGSLLLSIVETIEGQRLGGRRLKGLARGRCKIILAQSFLGTQPARKDRIRMTRFFRPLAFLLLAFPAWSLLMAQEQSADHFETEITLQVKMNYLYEWLLEHRLSDR